MEPNVVLLTTDTTHHAYFARELASRHAIVGAVVETHTHEAPFATAHPFEGEREVYEREHLLHGGPAQVSAYIDTIATPSVNDEEAIAAINSWDPDVLIVFGTGFVRHRVAEMAKHACLNLHGGDPEHYRGLDTHLWAIYHGDFDQLVTSLHHVAPAFDAGDIVFQQHLPLARETPLSRLRAINTEACIDMVDAALLLTGAGRSLPRRSQHQNGRYYSSMPAVLKDQVVDRFNKYTRSL